MRVPNPAVLAVTPFSLVRPPCAPHPLPKPQCPPLLPKAWQWCQGQGERRDPERGNLVPAHTCAEAFMALSITPIHGD